MKLVLLHVYKVNNKPEFGKSIRSTAVSRRKGALSLYQFVRRPSTFMKKSGLVKIGQREKLNFNVI